MPPTAVIVILSTVIEFATSKSVELRSTVSIEIAAISSISAVFASTKSMNEFDAWRLFVVIFSPLVSSVFLK